ncbi:2-C-methyl-D-erythritol 4-phosphate cytidylyltransferase [Vibrio aerogenes CECT 7868]|uniref:2-C-methyl-D-erythritol 4-phosphate cytidylyltransferase n=1 Tax=Vibrio aerogenes CECT 7868 TaxID=1216006 RepID=A0A1M5YEG8_9VIBR|nr:2-C-methyl-D-erythritol 4-phosphate cytidylyltransferase [Vibrio aerogenes]SHI10435.1 2-C-methyl-D-erythritol 4-phosphate cytidylyltransferase [Vibrio aerogenes CECT 7868]
MIADLIPVIIPAAGTGRRMKADIPKQYLKIHGKTVLEHTVSQLLSHPATGQIIVAVSDDDPYFERLTVAGHPEVKRVSGGKERSDTVLNALAALPEKLQSGWVMVHDAARPCVRHEDISRLVDGISEQDCGGILAVPVRDTMKRSVQTCLIEHTVDRVGLWHALTPQLFQVPALYEALSLAKANGIVVTDESSAMEWKGYHPKLITGHADNIKITQPEDLALAAFYLNRDEE